jgi:type II secretory pathway pseudopilin PulG
MQRRWPPANGDRGETLLELVVAIAILGVSIVAVGAGVVMSVKMSAIHRNQATAAAALHNFAETVAGAYQGCGGSTPPNYPALLSLAPPAGFSTPTATVKFWDPAASSFSARSCPPSDPGLQQVTLNLATNDQLVSESLVVVVRKP